MTYFFYQSVDQLSRKKCSYPVRLTGCPAVGGAGSTLRRSPHYGSNETSHGGWPPRRVRGRAQYCCADPHRRGRPTRYRDERARSGRTRRSADSGNLSRHTITAVGRVLPVPPLSCLRGPPACLWRPVGWSGSVSGFKDTTCWLCDDVSACWRGKRTLETVVSSRACAWSLGGRDTAPRVGACFTGSLCAAPSAVMGDVGRLCASAVSAVPCRCRATDCSIRGATGCAATCTVGGSA